MSALVESLVSRVQILRYCFKVMVITESHEFGCTSRVQLHSLVVLLFLSIAVFATAAKSNADEVDVANIDATELIVKLIDQTRGEASYSEMTMRIKRPTWSRTSKFLVWTRGREDSLIRFTAPPKDAGNATLKLADRMWTYAPTIRKAVRLPKSMMTQDWAGSDFSYNDLARTDELIKNYSHEVVEAVTDEGITTYKIESTPHESAPIVWGMEAIKIRDDGVLLEQVFYDQEMQIVKTLETLDLMEMSGRTIPKRMRMSKVDEKDSWTEIEYDVIEFDIEVDDRLFTQFALRGER